MQNIIKKLTSRKFLLALVGVVTGLAMALGVDGGEIKEITAMVGGIVTALGSIIAYNAAESKVDAAAAAAPVTNVVQALPLNNSKIMEGIAVEDLDDDQLRSLLQQMGFTYTEHMNREEMLAALDEETTLA